MTYPFGLLLLLKQDLMKLRLAQIKWVTKVNFEPQPSHLCLKGTGITGLCDYTQLFNFLPNLLSPPVQPSSLFLFSLFPVLGIELRASCLLDKHSTPGLYP